MNRHLPSELVMQQMNLALNVSAFLGHPQPVTYIELFLGVTDWKLTREDPPEYLGWYRVRVDGAPNPNASQHMRYWNGVAWSGVVLRHFSDELVEERSQVFASIEYSQNIIWCGLKKPHLVGYFDPLVLSPRSQRYVDHHQV
jgi:hypothetical protein